MTELEKHLLKAFKHLEASYNEQQSALNQAQSDLRTMFERTSQENQALQQHVTSLTEQDRKSTRLNSSHVSISYAVFCLKKKTTTHKHTSQRLHTEI